MIVCESCGKCKISIILRRKGHVPGNPKTPKYTAQPLPCDICDPYNHYYYKYYYTVFGIFGGKV